MLVFSLEAVCVGFGEGAEHVHDFPSISGPPHTTRTHTVQAVQHTTQCLYTEQILAANTTVTKNSNSTTFDTHHI